MKSVHLSSKPGHVTHGDVFDDLGFSAADTLEAKIKAEIWLALMRHIERHGFSQSYLVTALKAHQPDVSNLLKGKISRVSITRLIQYAGRLNLTAQVTVNAHAAAPTVLEQSDAATGGAAERASRIGDPLTA